LAGSALPQPTAPPRAASNDAPVVATSKAKAKFYMRFNTILFRNLRDLYRLISINLYTRQSEIFVTLIINQQMHLHKISN